MKDELLELWCRLFHRSWYSPVKCYKCYREFRALTQEQGDA